jgi:Tn3 transposase DDE domain
VDAYLAKPFDPREMIRVVCGLAGAQEARAYGSSIRWTGTVPQSTVPSERPRLHVLTFADDPDYRRQLKGMRNLQEGRQDLARRMFHGRRGELHRAYHARTEDQLGALGQAALGLTPARLRDE